MTDGPGFDPYRLLGVGVDADAIAVQLAYRARIREVHPDIAGAPGLAAAKRLNVARDWLLDPALRARLPRPWTPPHQPMGGTTRGSGPPGRHARAGPRPEPDISYDPANFDPFTFDFGPRTVELRAFLRAISALSRDERARLNYSLGDARPVHFERYTDYFGLRLWTRSRALRHAVSLVWEQGVDEEAPYVFPLGQLLATGLPVANAYAQWLLLGDFFRRELGSTVIRSEHVVEALAQRSTDPWLASVGHARYGPHGQRVVAFLRAADALSVNSAGRLARSWHRHLGRERQGGPSEISAPGLWLPSPAGYPEPLKVSGYLAAVDASRIEPPVGLDEHLRNGHRFGLRLTAHVLAIGWVGETADGYLRPWREAVDPDPSMWSQLRWRMPAG